MNDLDLSFLDALDLHQINRDRYDAVEQNMVRAVELLEKTRYQGMLLTCPENFAWFTAGGDSRLGKPSHPLAYLFITSQGRVILTTDAVAPQLFDQEIAGLGFQLKERLWTEGLDQLADEICRGRSVMSDSGWGRTRNLGEEIDVLRQDLSPYALNQQQQISQSLAAVVEHRARQLKPGQTEREIAAQLSADLLQARMVPVQIQVYGNDDHFHYPHWMADDSPVTSSCTISVVASQAGLHAAATRSVCWETARESTAVSAVAELLGRMARTFEVGKSSQEVFQECVTLLKQGDVGTNWNLAEFALQLGYRAPEQVLNGQEEQSIPDLSVWRLLLRLPALLLETTIRVQSDGPVKVLGTTDWPSFQFGAGDQSSLNIPLPLDLS